MSWGWETPTEYLQSLWIKDVKKMTFAEKIIIEEMRQLELIKDEINALEDNSNLESNEIIFPFPMEGKFRQEYIRNFLYYKKYKFVNLNDTLVIPPNLEGDEFFDDRLRNLKDVDIDHLIEKSRNDYKQIIDKGLVYKRRDKNASDPEFNKQINIISQAVKVTPITGDLTRGSTELSLDYYEERLLGNLPTEGRILVEEYYKALYLNDQDPEKYNFTYWLDYFKVSNVTLRNAFNYIFFPIPDENNPTEVVKILHFKDYEFDKRRKFIADMSKDEYSEYLTKTDERPELEEIKRLDYLTFQLSAKQPRISDRTVPTIDDEIDDSIDTRLINSNIMKQIDSQIGDFIADQVENQGLILDADIRLKLEEIKTKRLALDREEKMKFFENPELIQSIEKDKALEKHMIENMENKQLTNDLDKNKNEGSFELEKDHKIKNDDIKKNENILNTVNTENENEKNNKFFNSKKYQSIKNNDSKNN